MTFSKMLRGIKALSAGDGMPLANQICKITALAKEGPGLIQAVRLPNTTDHSSIFIPYFGPRIFLFLNIRHQLLLTGTTEWTQYIFEGKKITYLWKEVNRFNVESTLYMSSSSASSPWKWKKIRKRIQQTSRVHDCMGRGRFLWGFVFTPKLTPIFPMTFI